MLTLPVSNTAAKPSVIFIFLKLQFDMPRLSTNAVSVFSGKTLRMTPSRSNIILSMSMLTSLDGVSFLLLLSVITIIRVYLAMIQCHVIKILERYMFKLFLSPLILWCQQSFKQKTLLKSCQKVMVFSKKILMETKNSYLIKAKNAKDEDFNDLYFVNLDRKVDLAPKDLDAEILVFRKSEFAVIRADDVQVAELSQKLHHMAAACGHLVRLSGDEVNKDMQESFAPGALIAETNKSRNWSLS